MASGTALVVSDIGGFRELVTDGHDALVVPPRQSRALAHELRTLLHDEGRRAALAASGLQTAQQYSWDRVCERLEVVYGEVVGRRQQRRAALPTRSVELHADFHVHSEYSKDCATPVRSILERARELGIDIVAITDHNTVEGGLEGLRLADEYGLRVIAGEEIKSTEGEIVGLFLSSYHPRRALAFAETIAAIKAQGGIVYVPHPFDRLHVAPGLLGSCASTRARST